jgi:hypothetical protein
MWCVEKAQRTPRDIKGEALGLLETVTEPQIRQSRALARNVSTYEDLRISLIFLFRTGSTRKQKNGKMTRLVSHMNIGSSKPVNVHARNK